MAKHRVQDTFSTVVIGAGPGGLACAAELARRGKKVLLLEKRTEVGPKVCAGGITWSGLNPRLPPDLIEKSFCRQHIFSSWQQLAIDSATPIISTIDRRHLGQWMLAQALEAGVTVATGTRAIAIDGQTIKTSAGRFGFRFLVGADGSSSMVRRALGLPTEHLGAGIQMIVPGEFTQMEWHLDQELFHTGYAWVFPYRRAASVGAYGSRKGISPRRLLESLLAWGHRRGLDLKGRRPRAALINFDFRGWRFGSTFLVGDAAGLASGLTGEGIYPAIVSGETVARTIIDPGYRSPEMKRLIAKQRRHKRVLDLLGGRLACRVGLEALIFALRANWISFKALEMGDR